MRIIIEELLIAQCLKRCNRKEREGVMSFWMNMGNRLEKAQDTLAEIRCRERFDAVSVVEILEG